MMIDNKGVYSTVEFDSWANRRGLIAEERFLIDAYLNKKGVTLEAGTACGRILFEMKAMGFSSLYGFDYVAAFIELAKENDPDNSIHFDVQDAANLRYEDTSFDQLIYLQQIICFIEDEDLRYKALQEAYRILKCGGIVLFSFLCFDTRTSKPIYLAYLLYLKLLRRIHNSGRNIQYLPWLKHGPKLNLGAITDKGPYVYWYKTSEIEELLRHVGFQITAVGSTYQIERGEMCQTFDELRNDAIKGMIYVVCRK